MLQTKKNFFGFTIVEVLIFVSILVIVLSISFSFLLITFSGTAKADALKEVRQNGNYALSSMEKFIISTKDIECLSAQSVKVTMLDGSFTTFSCNGDRISSDSAYLTSEDVIVSDCSFSCTITSGVPAVLDINFTVSKTGEGLRASESVSLPFKSKLVIRNQKN